MFPWLSTVITGFPQLHFTNVLFVEKRTITRKMAQKPVRKSFHKQGQCIKIQKCEGRIPPALRKLAALCTGFFMAGRYRHPAVGEALHSWGSGFESVPSSPAHGGPASSSNPAIRRGARQQRGRAGHKPPGAAVRRGPGCPPRRMPRERPRPGEPPQIASRARQRARREAGKQTTREAPPIPWASAARARRPP